MGILKSYDLKINGMGRVVYLKKTQHDSPSNDVQTTDFDFTAVRHFDRS